VSDLSELLRNLYCLPATTAGLIGRCQSEMGVSLPDDYVAFLRIANGAEGFAGKAAYAILWGVDELAAMNAAYQVRQYCPGLLAFGSNGGGEAYGFDTRTLVWSVVQVPFVGMAWDLAQPLGESFGAFLERLRRPPDSETGDETGRGATSMNADTAGKEIFETKPIIFGGSPTDPANKVLLSRDEHIKAVVFWNEIVREARQKKRRTT
jgi:hypothetical protein